MKKLTTLVFDLDDTLLDTTQLLIPIAKTPSFYKRIQEPLPLMKGALENLNHLKTKYRLILLTQGHIESQNHKVNSTGIRSFFSDVWIVDPQTSDTKLTYFSRLAESLPKDEQFLSIGNRLSTDIREAKRVGGLTCWFRYGEHQNESIESVLDRADFQVETHAQLISICKL